MATHPHGKSTRTTTRLSPSRHGSRWGQAPVPARRQRGIVLVMAMLIVALVTTVVVSVSWRFHLSQARNENRWHGVQARAYLEGGEELARLLLREDAQQTQNDNLTEIWAQQGDPLPTDEGWIRGRIIDGHSRFNVNLLELNAGRNSAAFNVPGATPPPPVDPNSPDAERFSPTQKRFIRFLQTFELEENGPVTLEQAIEITEAIQDWLDPDNEPTGFGGKEADYYMNKETPYPIANGPITSVSDLMMIDAIPPELYKKLEPYLVALAPSAVMNINTVAPEILRGFNGKETLEPLPEAEWKALVEERQATMMMDESGAALGTGYQDVNAFGSSPVMQAVTSVSGGFDNRQLDVHSKFFLFEGETLVGEQVRRSRSILYREGASVEVVRRTDAGY